MADIQSAAQWLGRLIVEEANYLYKVQGKVQELRDELDWMQCFLRDVDASQYDNALARRWVAQIREFAYEAEDATEEFLNKVIITSSSTQAGSYVLSLLKRCSKFLWEARSVHKTGSEIDALKNKISLLSAKLHTYGIKLQMGGSSSSWMSKLRYNAYNNSLEEKIIGREDDLEVLVKQLKSKGGVRVISISGDGGVGKSFLADRIFRDSKIRKNFDAFAWAYVSRPFQSSAVQQDLLSSLTSKSKEQIAQMVDKELKEELCKVQCKSRCFIVLDGIWEDEVWKSLEKAFPITSPHYSSKLLITNIKDEVAKLVHPEAFIHKLEPLNTKDSQRLLEEKVKVPTDIPDDEDDDSRNKLYKLKEKMLDYCQGLPLAISVLGGVLAAKRSLKEWQKVDNYISSITDDEHPIPKWRRILELSYYDLPYQLKPSFVYLGHFPSNMEISTTKIFRLWEAEGLVPSGDDELSEETLENVAERCLSELIERSLLQVGSRSLAGRAKTCRVHNLMHTLCEDKGKRGNWLSIVPFGAEEDQADQPLSSKIPKSSRLAKKKFRRLVIYYSRNSGELPSVYRNARYIRSLLFFNTLETDEVLIPLKRNVLKKAIENYKLLRVLDIENIEVRRLPRDVGLLFHLRYLSLRGSCVAKLPSTIKNLRCLQTLDLRVLSFVHLRIPDVLYKMDRLVHLYLPSNSFSDLCKEDKLSLKDLRFLETLSNFSNKCIAKDVGTLRSLRKFSSCDFLARIDDIEPLLGSSKLEHLLHMSLKLEGQLFKEYSEALGRCNELRKLWVKGEIAGSLDSGMIPDNLIRLSFHHSKFQIDPMQVLEKLPHLKKLSLKHDSYMGTTMKCTKEGFSKLTHLTLKGLEMLEYWELEGGAMLKLSHLKITDCRKLKMIPEGLRFVKELRVLAISFMPLSFFGGLSPKDIHKWFHFRKVKHALIKISHVLELEEDLDIEVIP